MYRATLNIGRRGVVLHAISAVDIALWDLFGKQLGVPVYELLGGKLRASLPAYASWLYATEDLDALAAEAAGWAAQGFTAVKQRLPYGPLEGRSGIRRNVELVRTVVEAVGPDVDVMADAYMSWDAGYAIRCIRAFEDAGLRLRWLEEPLVPDDIPGLARGPGLGRDADRGRRARGDAVRLPRPGRGRRGRRPAAGREPPRRDHRGAARLGAR